MGRHHDKSQNDKKPETDAADAIEAAIGGERSSEADKFWEKVGLDPIVIHLGKSTGLTLRGYRTVEPEELEEELEEDDLDEDLEDEEEEEEEEEEKPAKKGKGKKKAKGKAAEEEKRPDVVNPEDTENYVEPEVSDFMDEPEEEEIELVRAEKVTPSGPMDVPYFLSKNGKILLFDDPKKLVKYVKSQAKHDLTELDTFKDLQKNLKTEYVVCDEADNYELDLVVTNLRGGHDAWEPELLIGAGEIARDIGQALELQTVTDPLAEGSPLDDLDNSLRSITEGGFRSFFAKRRLRRVSTEQAAIAWRGIIGKISEAADWRKSAE